MNTLRRGWCPSLFHPMQAGDGWLCRIKPFFSCLTSQQALFIAQAAKQYGNGFINLSQRGNLQLRGFTKQAFQEFIPLAIKNHLCSPTQIQEKKRNLLIPPLGKLDQTIHPETRKIINLIQESFIENDQILFPSDKFNILIDGNGLISFNQETADINIRNIQQKWFIQLGNHPSLLVCSIQNISSIILDILHFCHKYQIKRFTNLENANIYLKQTSYQKEFYILPQQPSLAIGKFSLGLHIAIPFGLLTYQTLHHLAQISKQHGDSEIHLTPWRSIILSGCSDNIVPSLNDFITNHEDPRLKIILCLGKPYCIQGLQPVLDDVRHIIPAIKPLSPIMHISGCTKGCASPKQTAITFCATPTGYNLILDGKADDKPIRKDLSLKKIINLLNNIN